MFDNLQVLLIRFVTHIKTRNGLVFIRILLIQFNFIPFSEGKNLGIKNQLVPTQKIDDPLLYSIHELNIFKYEEILQLIFNIYFGCRSCCV